MSESHETRPDRVLIAIPTRCRHWWNDCMGCALEGRPIECAKLDKSLLDLRGVGCRPRQRWIEAKL